MDMNKANQCIYQIFTRNYSNEGTFKRVEEDLPRIKELGIDIVYLLPIHEIGEINRKGTYGSPYSIKDYYSICSMYGTLEDFKSLVNKVHEYGMNIILDMVFNHTSYDNVLIKEHPDFYFYRDGHLANKVGDWSDICDLETSKEETQEYLLNVLKYWIDLDVDGFRFDVASMIPLSFFKKARKLLGEKVIFIGESISVDFVSYLKSINVPVTEDKDMIPPFDSLYNYSWFHSFTDFLKGKGSLETFINIFNSDSLNNGGTYRVNCLDNHDNERIASFTNESQLRNALEFVTFIKGNLFIYAGGENGDKKKPPLFEKEAIDNTYNLSIYSLYKECIEKKHHQKEIIHQYIKQVDEHSFIVHVTYFDNSEEERLFIF